MTIWCPVNYIHFDDSFVAPVPMFVPVEELELENPWEPNAALNRRCAIVANVTVEATRQMYDPEYRKSS